MTNVPHDFTKGKTIFFRITVNVPPVAIPLNPSRPSGGSMLVKYIVVLFHTVFSKITCRYSGILKIYFYNKVCVTATYLSTFVVG